MNGSGAVGKGGERGEEREERREEKALHHKLVMHEQMNSLSAELMHKLTILLNIYMHGSFEKMLLIYMVKIVMLRLYDRHSSEHL